MFRTVIKAIIIILVKVIKDNNDFNYRDEDDYYERECVCVYYN